MTPPVRALALVLVLAATAEAIADPGMAAPGVPAQGAQTQGPLFRTGVTTIPLDVRVVDRQGHVVSDLTRDDFIVLEDGVQQTITHFERHALTPAVPGPLPSRSTGAPFALDTGNRRIFYIELGRVWLANARFGLVEALAKFLRERLLPQDYAVVSSFGRMTALTTDHEALAQVVERIAAFHYAMEHSANPWTTVPATYGWRRQPVDSLIRRAFDEAFAPASEGLRLSLKPATEFKSTLDAVTSNFMAGQRLSLEAVQASRVLESDVLTLLGALQYLHFIEGEKHLVYFPGMAMASVDDDRQVARIANDARVALHVIGRTNGLPTGRLDLTGDMSAKNIAGWTGGSVFLNRWPDEALAKIDEVTRSGYLLAYSPIKAAADERYRKITIRVKRPDGAKVIVREGYRSTATPQAYDPATFTAKQHILTVAEFPGGVDDLGVTVTATASPAGTLRADVVIDLSRVPFSMEGDRHLAKLEMAVFCNDARGRLVGQHWVTLDLKLKDETWAKAVTEGLRQTLNVPVTTRVRNVKAVVYDYGTSRAGAGTAEVK